MQKKSAHKYSVRLFLCWFLFASFLFCCHKV